MNTNEIKGKIKNILGSNNFKTAIYTIGVLVILFIVFQIGMIA